MNHRKFKKKERKIKGSEHSLYQPSLTLKESMCALSLLSVKRLCIARDLIEFSCRKSFVMSPLRPCHGSMSCLCPVPAALSQLWALSVQPDSPVVPSKLHTTPHPWRDQEPWSQAICRDTSSRAWWNCYSSRKWKVS